ncbi:uncharacterized protein [Hetaerina americana]|uniref:uncharacterized protein n=1 Tax=Hetaerina americana TaxID=62018 RepID=UPI003A7F4F17
MLTMRMKKGGGQEVQSSAPDSPPAGGFLAHALPHPLRHRENRDGDRPPIAAPLPREGAPPPHLDPTLLTRPADAPLASPTRGADPPPPSSSSGPHAIRPALSVPATPPGPPLPPPPPPISCTSTSPCIVLQQRAVPPSVPDDVPSPATKGGEAG